MSDLKTAARALADAVAGVTGEPRTGRNAAEESCQAWSAYRRSFDRRDSIEKALVTFGLACAGKEAPAPVYRGLYCATCVHLDLHGITCTKSGGRTIESQGMPTWCQGFLKG